MKKLSQINNILDSVEYGVLSLSKGVIPYAVAVNFARIDNKIYIHGSKKGKKIDYLKINKNVSFSVVKPLSIIPSYFSSKSNLACPATQFFISVIIDGIAEIIEEYDQKVKALSALMEKLQKEGGYIDLNETIYNKSINATAIIKITPYNYGFKAKLGQNLTKERFDMIIENLQKRADPIDIETIELMKNIKDSLN